MKKLRLDDLHVDTFATGPALAGEGTVRAHLPGSGPSYDQPCEPIDPNYTEVNCPPYTAAASCNGTCYASCYGSCNSCNNTCYTCYQNTCMYGTCYPCYPQEPEI
ncbi:hypothetical protein [Longimicrobium sp.]|uniref:hypothetical protein n=1 Tax=Longimicrobium sp. TaxID=2029185 RepID=UPI002E2F87A2|nr:hypothetical protein [Longimicrobium sp.]HEX6041029.1 hypothetical protein [Longimicrobium sp.]